MLTIRQCREALVEEIKAAGLFEDVRAYPFRRTNEAAFLKDLPGLTLPACLVVNLGRTTTVKGSGREHLIRWSAVIVAKDPGGDAADITEELVDQFADAILDQQIEDKELTINGSHDVSVAFSVARFSVQEVAFTTREAAAR